jgi:hypothetical protein
MRKARRDDYDLGKETMEGIGYMKNEGNMEQHLLKVMQNQLKISDTSRTWLKRFSFTAERGEGYEVGGGHQFVVIRPCNVWILQFQPS